MSLLASIYDKIENKLNIFLDSKNWKIKIIVVSIFLMILSFFSNISALKHFPDYYKAVFKEKKEYYIYQTIEDRAADFTKDWVYTEPSFNNRTYRLTLPLLVKLLNIKHVSIFLYGLQVILGILFLFILTNFLYLRTDNKIITFYALIGFVTIYLGTSFFIDIDTFGDFFSFFFLFLAIYFRNPVLIFIFLSMAFWNDERTFVGSGLVFLWWWLIPQFDKECKFKVEINLQMFSIILAWCAYWLIRKFYLTDYLGMHPNYVDGEFLEIFISSLTSFGLKFFWVYEFWWITILLCFCILLYKKDYLRFSLILGAFMVMQFLALTTFDSTRSGSFGFIILPLILVILKKNLTDSELKILLFIIAVGCLLHPLTSRTNSIGFFLM